MADATMVLTGGNKLISGANKAKEREVVDHLFERLDLKAASSSAPVRTLSGGSQQKVVLGRWLTQSPPGPAS